MLRGGGGKQGALRSTVGKFGSASFYREEEFLRVDQSTAMILKPMVPPLT